MDGLAIDARQLAELCAQALDALHLPVIVCDEQTILFANGAAAAVFRAQSASEIIGLPVDELAHPDMHAASAARRPMLTSSRRELLGIPVKLVGRDGSVISTIADAHPAMFDDQVVLVYTYGTGRPGVPTANGSSPANGFAGRRSVFAAALEVLPQIAVIHDDELVLFANAACRRFLAAQSPDDLEGLSVDTIIHPDAHQAGRERRRLVMDSAQPLRDVPLKVLTLGGEAKHVTVDAHPIATNGTKAVLVVAQNGAQ